MSQPRILIVGGGVAGLSTAWHLARAGRGADVVLVEREAHLASQSSALNAAILRTLGPDPLSTRIALRSAAFLRDPPTDFSDVPLVEPRGLVLVAGRDMAEALRAWVKSLGESAHVAEELSPAAVHACHPAFSGEVRVAYRFSDEGQIDIAALCAGFARGARSGGVRLRRKASVDRLLCEQDRVVGAVLDGGEQIRADVTVLAAGGWAGRLGRAAGSRVQLRPTRRHLMVTVPTQDVDRQWPVLWHLGSEHEGEGGFYCRPESGGMLLCACDLCDVDPDHLERRAEALEEIAEKTSRALPRLANAGIGRYWCGVRTLTADHRFAIGRDPDRDGLFWVAGLAGSGMVCSAEVGRIAAALLLGDEVEPDVVTGLAPGRLRALS